MAIIPPSNSQSVNGAIWQQLQQQQAQRAADQAEQNASALQVKAREAQSQAMRAQENARSLKVQYTQAESEAGSARQGLAELKAVGALQQGLQATRDSIASSRLNATTTGSATTVINAQGQTTGSLVNVTA